MKNTFVDVDGHLMEPAGIWQEYIEPKYRDRALRIERDEKGLEYIWIDGRSAWFAQGGTLGALGAIGQDVRPFLVPGKISWKEAMLPAGYDSHERIKVMDAEEIDMTLVYPSLGLTWENDCQDPKVAAANCRAYNNWVFDFCAPYPNRLIPVAHIPMKDVREAVKELKRTVRLGAKAVMLVSESPSGHPYGSRYYDPLWAEAEALGVPVTIHPATGNHSVTTLDYPKREEISTWWIFVFGGENVKMSFTSFFNEGTFDRFPELKVVVLESGIGWIVWWIDRMDEKFEVNGFTTPMKQMPSEYFRRQGYISMDPDERLAKFSIGVLGADRFLWAYDYPHSDSILEPVRKLQENLSPLPKKDQLKVFGGNAMQLYQLAD